MTDDEKRWTGAVESMPCYTAHSHGVRRFAGNPRKHSEEHVVVTEDVTVFGLGLPALAKLYGVQLPLLAMCFFWLLPVYQLPVWP